MNHTYSSSKDRCATARKIAIILSPRLSALKFIHPDCVKQRTLLVRFVDWIGKLIFLFVQLSNHPAAVAWLGVLRRRLLRYDSQLLYIDLQEVR